MSFSAGNKLKITLFGTSHGPCIGATLAGIKAGISFDFDEVRKETDRRKSRLALSTPRREEDNFQIISGICDGTTDGGPITVIFPNNDTDSRDYDRYIPRPGHADYPAFVKYAGMNDHRGGGFFSGRMTAPLVFAGALCKQILKQKGIKIFSHIKSVKDLEEASFAETEITDEMIDKLTASSFPCIEKEKEFLEIIEKAENDSVGGVCEIMATGIAVGVGEPFFDSVESTLAKLVFSVHGIKGIEFGYGFGITRLYGSQANDEIVSDGEITLKTNHSGGINGGLTNGMPLLFRVAVRPTPTVSLPQNTVNLKTGENETIVGRGRHDKAIILRIAPIMEAVTAMGLCDLI